MGNNKIKFGILGTARIASEVLIKPAKYVPEVEIAAVASRDIKRAQAFSKKYCIKKVYSGYEALLLDSEIDAVYLPLPNSLHSIWAINAMNAGKHVLCEKPIASNEKEAKKMATVAKDTAKILLEGMHYKFHPMIKYIKNLIDMNEIGHIRHIESKLLLPSLLFISKKNFRYDYNLSGGATMDVGCYSINLIRFLAGIEPIVIHSKAKKESEQIDKLMTADFVFHDPSTDRRFSARMTCSLSSVIPNFNTIIYGDKGKIKVVNPYAPHLFNSLTIVNEESIKKIKFSRNYSTYKCQLLTFVKAALARESFQIDMKDSINNMKVIDSIYRRSYMKCRSEQY